MQGHEDSVLFFSPRFIVLGFTFRFVGHGDVKYGSVFILLHMKPQLLQHHLLKRLHLLSCPVFASLSNTSSTAWCLSHTIGFPHISVVPWWSCISERRRQVIFRKEDSVTRREPPRLPLSPGPMPPPHPLLWMGRVWARGMQTTSPQPCSLGCACRWQERTCSRKECRVNAPAPGTGPSLRPLPVGHGSPGMTEILHSSKAPGLPHLLPSFSPSGEEEPRNDAGLLPNAPHSAAPSSLAVGYSLCPLPCQPFLVCFLFYKAEISPIF